MGQEIVYCFKCQKRIVGADYDKGLAYQLENNSCCSSCAVQVLDTLPPKAKEQLLGKMFKATHEHQSTSSSHKALNAPAPAASTRRIVVMAPPEKSSSTGLLVGVGAAVVVVIVLVVVLSSGSSTPLPPLPPRPATVAAPPPPPGPPPEEKRRTEAAREALRKAKEFAIVHPRDYADQIREWRVALLEAERTGYEAEVKRELEKTEQRAREAAVQELADLEKETRRLTEKRDFKAALDLLAKERPRRAAADLDRLEQEVRSAADRAFADLKAKAMDARGRGARAEIEAAKIEAARWGFPNFVAELHGMLEGPWRPIFDGRTLRNFSSQIANAWRVEDGMLVHDNAVDNAAIVPQQFGDGEYRIRFRVQGVDRFTFRFRMEAKSHEFIDLRQDELRPLFDSGEHELLFVARPDAASATVDGKPVKVQRIGTPKAGMIQFNAFGGSCRIKSLEFREAP